MEMPDSIKMLEQYKGFPITATTLIVDGKPNFKATDPEKVWEFKRDGKCSICGQSLNYWIAFMVTEEEAKTGLIYESPNHEACLRYAFKICPWLAYSNAKYTDLSKNTTLIGSHPDRALISGRPEKLGIYICKSYENVIIKKPYTQYVFRVCKVPKAKRIEWIEGV